MEEWRASPSGVPVSFRSVLSLDQHNFDSSDLALGLRLGNRWMGRQETQTPVLGSQFPISSWLP